MWNTLRLTIKTPESRQCFIARLRLISRVYHSIVLNSSVTEAVTMLPSMDWFLYDNGLRHERVKFWSKTSSRNSYVECVTSIKTANFKFSLKISFHSIIRTIIKPLKTCSTYPNKLKLSKNQPTFKLLKTKYKIQNNPFTCILPTNIKTGNSQILQ